MSHEAARKASVSLNLTLDVYKRQAVATKKITRISEIVSELEAFLERRGFDTTCYHESWNAILEALVRTLRDTRLSRDESTPFRCV